MVLNKQMQFGREMQVRRLVREDLPALLEMNQKQIEESRFPHLKVNVTKMRNWYLNFINNPRSAVFVLIDDDNQLAGAAAVGSDQFFWNYHTYVMDYFFYLYPEYRRGLNAKLLYDAIYRWAVEIKAIEIQLSYAYGDNPERLNRFYSFMGYEKIGEHYLREVI